MFGSKLVVPMRPDIAVATSDKTEREREREREEKNCSPNISGGALLHTDIREREDALWSEGNDITTSTMSPLDTHVCLAFPVLTMLGD